ncbi:Hypothetical protein FKW44_016297 [Caligus rogercresseyi]|uniref:Uncharacterized protein n=1 Tax=Caligus rogercresseyi TaxID=217165 RepID=A0A7T8H1J9_CALRO|nr:Hypothetical protein FKW44_016297 [Caligus rogercresseyi]
MSIKLVVPSKVGDGQTFEGFGDSGITLSRAGSDREYAGQLTASTVLSLVLLSAGEIRANWRLGTFIWVVTGTIWCTKNCRFGTRRYRLWPSLDLVTPI